MLLAPSELGMPLNTLQGSGELYNKEFKPGAAKGINKQKQILKKELSIPNATSARLTSPHSRERDFNWELGPIAAHGCPFRNPSSPLKSLSET